MTDETDHSKADSGRSDHAKEQAEVLSTAGPADDPDVFLVEYPDGAVEYEPATPRNQALFGEGLYGEIDGVSAYDAGGVPVELEADVASGTYTISVEGETVHVPSNRIDDAIEAVQSAFVGTELYELYRDITEGQVRRATVSRFEDRFPDDRVEITESGWVVDETFLVTYEAENHLVGVDPVDPYSNEVDESKQAVYLDLNPDGERTVRAPDGEAVTLDEIEQEFLTTVEALLYPENYFGVELVDEIQQHKAESEALDDVFEDLANDATVTGFTDSKTGIHHGSNNHDFTKHDVSDLNVTDEVRDKLWSNPYDHAGVRELLLRRREFVNNPDVDVFRDADDNDEWKWDEIEKTSENAPIPPDVENKLQSMFGE